MGIKKILGFALTAVGAVGTITGTVLLPVGCLKTYTIKMSDENGNELGKMIYGVGSSNYGSVKMESSSSGYDLQEIEDYYNDGKEVRKNMKYSDLVKIANNTIDNWNSLKDTIPTDGFNNANEIKSFLESIVSANNMRIAGALLLPLFAVIMIIGIVFIVLSKKQKS